MNSKEDNFCDILDIETYSFILYQGVQKGSLSGYFFRIFEIIIFLLVVAKFDIVHDVEAIKG